MIGNNRIRSLVELVAALSEAEILLFLGVAMVVLAMPTGTIISVARV
jgi:hypothetical protein